MSGSVLFSLRILVVYQHSGLVMRAFEHNIVVIMICEAEKDCWSSMQTVAASRPEYHRAFPAVAV